MLLKLLAHPLTQPYISDGDQLALSYLESVTVSKAKSTAAAAAAATAAIDGDDDDSKARQEGTAPETDVPKKMVAGEREAHLGGAGANELDDDDDVGFRVTFVSVNRGFTARDWEWYATRRMVQRPLFTDLEVSPCRSCSVPSGVHAEPPPPAGQDTFPNQRFEVLRARNEVSLVRRRDEILQLGSIKSASPRQPATLSL